MAIDERLLEFREAQRHILEVLDRAERVTGGGGGGGDMEKRLDRLENQFEKMREDNTAIKVQLATLNERVAHLPSKGFMVNALLTALGAMAAMFAFADKIKSLVG